MGGWKNDIYALVFYRLVVEYIYNLFLLIENTL